MGTGEIEGEEENLGEGCEGFIILHETKGVEGSVVACVGYERFDGANGGSVQDVGSRYACGRGQRRSSHGANSKGER